MATSYFYLYMDEDEQKKFQKFCQENNDSPVMFSLFPKFNGPLSTSLNVAFRSKHIMVDAQSSSTPWAFIFSQHICKKFKVKEVDFNSLSYPIKIFAAKNPFGARLALHKKVLSCLPNKKSAIIPHHQEEIERLNGYHKIFTEACEKIFSKV